MREPLLAYLQYLTPQHLLTALMKKLAEIRSPNIKNWMIQRFIKRYKVDMSLAEIENIESYPDFNHFFICKLKANLRPIAKEVNAIASPADGTIAQIGEIQAAQLLQAKHFYFNLDTLLGGDKSLAELFYDGSYATLYLAPCDYHRVHMPFSGKLIKTIYVPGKLFSVNRMTSEFIPNLYSRNERLISLFDTAAGPMAIILVGAMIVGSIQTVWMEQPVRGKQIRSETFSDGMYLQKGQELGHFKLGSTVILLFQKNKSSWLSSLESGVKVQFGQQLGNIL